MRYYDSYYPPYVPVARRRANAAKELTKLLKKGVKALPIKIEGRKIAATFWGKAWCDHLESFSDFKNRLPRGRTYVRNGSVVHLDIAPGKISAHVAGSNLYTVSIAIKKSPDTSWKSIKSACAGQISSLIDLLQGKLSDGVMKIITDPAAGLFPKPAEIDLDCSCPDGAHMCKHIAAVLYGIGARLDHQPELLFRLRQVDHLDLLSQSSNIASLTAAAPGQKTIRDTDLADVFGIDLEAGPEKAPAKAAKKLPAKKAARPKKKK